jgi:hypothetical protein
MVGSTPDHGNKVNIAVEQASNANKYYSLLNVQ